MSTPQSSIAFFVAFKKTLVENKLSWSSQLSLHVLYYIKYMSVCN
ncbi:hypothetical protein STRDD04_01944 [Streptococcus sp. DD04]|nr:hypothetical protein STRDD04_01944 [Streptococcus sp. DD04]